MGRPIRNTSNSGTGIRDTREASSTAPCPGQEQPTRVAARVGQLEQLEVADDVLIEDDDVVEPFQEVEGDLRLPLGGRTADVAEVIVDGEHLHLVAHLA